MKIAKMVLLSGLMILAGQAGLAQTRAEKDAELKEALNEILRTDQSDPGHTKAPECYKKLLQLKDVYVGKRLEPDYYNAMSIEAFHMGQNDAMDKQTEFLVLRRFEASLRYAKKAQKSWTQTDYAEGWVNYLKLTIAYLKGERRRVEELHERCGYNAETAARLFNGLNKFGKPDYARDYAGVEPKSAEEKDAEEKDAEPKSAEPKSAEQKTLNRKIETDAQNDERGLRPSRRT